METRSEVRRIAGMGAVFGLCALWLFLISAA